MKEKVRIIIIEDNVQLAKDARREIEDAFKDSTEIEPEVSVENDFEEGFDQVRQGNFDVVILDVRRDASIPSEADDSAGQTIFLRLKELCFTPVVFWTALPGDVMHLRMLPLVDVVSKEETVKLPAAIQAAVASHAMRTISGIEQQVAAVMRKHMWAELAPNWAEYTEHDSEGIAQVLLTRLARVLEDDSEKSFTAHPSHRYVYPPTSDRRAPGDVLRSLKEDSQVEWWMILTPACDFEQGKVAYVLLAKASPLEEQQKYQNWVEANLGSSNEKDRWNSLEQDIIMATRGRFHYLPAFREIPDLAIDLENVQSIPVQELDSFTPVASLVSPFAEALLIQHSQYRGRIGVPDLNSQLVKQRLLAKRAGASS